MGARIADVGLPPDLPRAERLRHILERDGGECVWCRRPAWAENELAACRPCNRARGHTAPVAWLEDCEARGLQPNREVVARTLLALRAAIAARRPVATPWSAVTRANVNFWH